MARGDGSALVLGAVAVAAAGTVILLAASAQASAPVSRGTRLRDEPEREPTPARPAAPSRDVVALARMFASENGSGSDALLIELAYTQLRSVKTTVYDRLTAGSGYGPQGESAAGGGVRPVSTDQEPEDRHLRIASAVLAGMHAPQFESASSFFEPRQQDRAFEIAERARKKRQEGQALTAQEQRLIGYRKNADALRTERQADGLVRVGTIDGVEFWGYPRASTVPVKEGAKVRDLFVWPIAERDIRRIGDSVTADRDGTGRQHYGLDIFAPAFAAVLSATDGVVRLVLDGRLSTEEGKRRAGLWCDVDFGNQYIVRYLHLHECFVKKGETLVAGITSIGMIARPGKSGSGKESHLHFEIRRRGKSGYGDPVNPLRLLPKRRVPNV